MKVRVPTSVIVTRYSWIVPIIVEMGDKYFDRKTIVEMFKISSKLARSLIWVLSRLSLIEKVDDYYRIADEKIVEEVSGRVICKRDRKIYVLREGQNIIIVNVKRHKITVRKVDRNLVERVYKSLRGKEACTLREISEIVSENASKVSTALRALEICGIVEKYRDGSGISFYSLRSATDPSLISRLILR